MLSTTIFGLAFAGLSSAQSTVSLFLAGTDPMPLLASVIGSDATATTYAVQCPPGTDGNDCGIGGGLILTQGPATVAYTMELIYENGTSIYTAYSGYLDCSMGGTTTAVCTESNAGPEANDPGMSTTTYAGSEIEYQVATLTSSSLSVTAVPADTASVSSASSTASTGPTKTGSSGSTSKTSSSGSTGATQSSSTSTGGMAMITGNAWIIGGAALAAALL